MKPYYDHGGITIYHGDCRDALADISASLVVTDPPYDVRAGRGGGTFGGHASLVNTGGFTDGGCDFSFLTSKWPGWFCFCSLKQLEELLVVASAMDRRHLLTWCKSNPVPTCRNKYLPDVEYIVHGFSKGRLFGGYKDRASFISHRAGDKHIKDRSKVHPNEKPLSLISRLIRLGSKEGETILDPFMGSGTTLRAAKDLGRKAIGIDTEEWCCEVAAKRLAQEVMDFT